MDRQLGVRGAWAFKEYAYRYIAFFPNLIIRIAPSMMGRLPQRSGERCKGGQRRWSVYFGVYSTFVLGQRVDIVSIFESLKGMAPVSWCSGWAWLDAQKLRLSSTWPVRRRAPSRSPLAETLGLICTDSHLYGIILQRAQDMHKQYIMQ
jgi:hypothetical protein